MDLESDVLRCVCLGLRRSARLVTQYYDDMLRPSGLRITQFSLLSALQRFEQSTVTPLADFLGMDRTTLSRNLDVLSARGLVTVVSQAQDRRQQVIRLTPSGMAALELAKPQWRKAQRQIVRHLTKSRTESLLKDLQNATPPSESS